MKQDSTREPKPQRLRDRMRETVATAILDAAERTFSEQGVQTAKMEAIAAAAGVAVGTLYNYFEDRTELFRALVDARKSEMLDKLDEALSESDGKPFRTQLEIVLQRLLAHFDAHRGFFAILMQGEAVQLGIASGHPPKETMMAMFQRLDKLVRRGVDQGVLRKDDVELYPVFLFGACRGVIMRALGGKMHGPVVNEVGGIVRFFLHGAGAK